MKIREEGLFVLYVEWYKELLEIEPPVSHKRPHSIYNSPSLLINDMCEYCTKLNEITTALNLEPFEFDGYKEKIEKRELDFNDSIAMSFFVMDLQNRFQMKKGECLREIEKKMREIGGMLPPSHRLIEKWPTPKPKLKEKVKKKLRRKSPKKSRKVSKPVQ